MKKLILVTVMFVAACFGSMAFAGGDVSPLYQSSFGQTNEPPKVPAPPMEKCPAYLGLGYSYMQLNTKSPDGKLDGHGLTATLGLDLLQHTSVELRATYSINGGDGTNISDSNELYSIGGYIKQGIQIGNFEPYVLGGYTHVRGHDEYDGLTYGGGISTMITDDYELSLDYRRQLSLSEDQSNAWMLSAARHL